MKFKGYRIHLANENGGQESLDYDLYENPVAQKWAHLTQQSLQQKAKPSGVSINIHADENSAQRILEKISKQLEIVDHEKLIEPFPFPRHDFKLIHQDQLNRLHEDFHRYEESVREMSLQTATRSALNQVNILIHELENVFKNLETKSRESQYIVFYLSGEEKIPMELSDYDLCQEAPLYGEMVLGYGTTGKTFATCFGNKDIELIQKKLVRPQTTISTEVILCFFPSPEKPDFSVRKKAQIIQWLHEIEAEKYGYDLSDKRYTSFFYPKLGMIKKEYRPEQITELFTKFPQITHVELL